MESEAYRSAIDKAFKQYFRDFFDIEDNRTNGIDILDPIVGIEIKSRLRKYNTNWRVHHYQVKDYKEEYPGWKLFWMFVLYDLTKEVNQVSAQDEKNLIKLVRNVEAWFIHWDWIKNKPVYYPKSGPFVYIGKKHFPRKFKTLAIKDNILYIPEKCKVLEELVNHH